MTKPINPPVCCGTKMVPIYDVLGVVYEFYCVHCGRKEPHKEK